MRVVGVLHLQIGSFRGPCVIPVFCVPCSCLIPVLCLGVHLVCMVIGLGSEISFALRHVLLPREECYRGGFCRHLKVKLCVSG